MEPRLLSFLLAVSTTVARKTGVAHGHAIRLLVAVVLLSSAVAGVSAQEATVATGAPVVYFTPAEEDAAIYALAVWTLEQPSSLERPGATRKEYGEKVLEFIKKCKPRPISYAMYRELHTEGQYMDGRGDSLFSTWKTMRAVPREISRTSVGEIELATYQWQNADGSTVTGMFRNGFLVSKAQNGLQ